MVLAVFATHDEVLVSRVSFVRNSVWARSLICSFLSAAWLLAGCQSDRSEMPQSEPVAAGAPVAQPVALVATNASAGRTTYDPKSDEMLFVFDGFGAGLTIPRRWQEGDVSIERLTPASGSYVEERAYGVRFHPVNSADSQAPYYLAVVRVYEEAAWDTNKGIDRTTQLELARVMGKVYAYGILQANQPADGTAESERFDQLVIDYEEAAAQLAVKLQS